MQREESSFLKTLERGEKLLEKIIERVKQEGKTQLDGRDAFTLYDTYGFPLELTQEIAEEQSLTVDLEGFEAAMQEQVDTSKGAHQTIDMMAKGSLNEISIRCCRD
jgi:alanyl-tRNA synthetase